LSTSDRYFEAELEAPVAVDDFRLSLAIVTKAEAVTQ